MSKTIKLKQSDIERIVTKIVTENMNNELDEIDGMDSGEGMELKLGLTDNGGYVLYKTNPDGSEEVVKKFDK
ncbi:MAG: hypothetical protein RLZ10_1709 [Bacteroidota bacterium]|jgi:hypothetical protein